MKKQTVTNLIVREKKQIKQNELFFTLMYIGDKTWMHLSLVSYGLF